MASPPYSLVINISPMDCTTENGAVEIWPGTHMLVHPDEGNHAPKEVLEDRRQHSATNTAGDEGRRSARPR
ncbi:MAG: hypothetical protein U5O39_11980 [Gammaproteobacteria bacterium]|nr:hypothetical protein [Gammaproteobacteria bacterium]